jgi:hypothetical protein
LFRADGIAGTIKYLAQLICVIASVQAATFDQLGHLIRIAKHDVRHEIATRYDLEKRLGELFIFVKKVLNSGGPVQSIQHITY